MKFSDRFFYENGNFPATRFTLDQLSQIRKVTLSKLYCDNLGLGLIKANSFATIQTQLDLNNHISKNKLVSCSDKIPGIDFSFWSDQLSNKISG